MLGNQGDGESHKTIANNAMSLQYGHRSLCMVIVVVLEASLIQSFFNLPGASNLDEVLVGHAFLLLDHDGHLHNLAKACRARIACLEMF
jgi:ATP-dependent protease Clp ATPase subunit